jgi:hypothetical protein
VRLDINLFASQADDEMAEQYGDRYDAVTRILSHSEIKWARAHFHPAKERMHDFTVRSHNMCRVNETLSASYIPYKSNYSANDAEEYINAQEQLRDDL